MSINPGVRLVAEGSGDLIAEIPDSAYSLVPDAEVVLTENEGSPTVYKVEKQRYYADINTHIVAGQPDSISTYGRTDLIVSVVTP